MRPPVRVVVGGGVLGPPSGQAQEDVVKARLLRRDGRNHKLSLVEAPDGLS